MVVDIQTAEVVSTGFKAFMYIVGSASVFRVFKLGRGWESLRKDNQIQAQRIDKLEKDIGGLKFPTTAEIELCVKNAVSAGNKGLYDNFNKYVTEKTCKATQCTKTKD